MKAVFFNKPLELALEISGESWQQGQQIKGELLVKNHGNSDCDLSEWGVLLAAIDTKKVLAKKYESAKISNEILFTAGTIIKSQGQELLPFTIELSSDCPITDKKSSLYLLCGNKKQPEGFGNLQLNVIPVKIISDYLQVFVDLLRFKVKSLKSKKDFIEVTMDVPVMKEFTSIQQFKLLVRIKDNNLEVKYNFLVKKLSFEGPTSLGTKDEEVKVSQLITPEQYKIYGNAFNQAGIKNIIDEALSKVRVKSLK